ncbi:hypothetical protein Pr1d_37270 [Bythopirellula goksoeyrii]|uniref:Uncharacterized protein n=1 Tax=Bythopirellula goksoeyrii TaxID=1400387 RepID=A0A5B9QR09_9BACT|nr:hypothetical protein Pr1d_37270 [Bythopirellula goksoeyrii]
MRESYRVTDAACPCARVSCWLSSLYIIRTRGIRGFQTIVYALILVGVMIACMVAAEYVTLVIGEANGLWDLSP